MDRRKSASQVTFLARMTEEQRLRFLRRALGDGLLTVEEYEGLKPRMTCRSGDVMPEDGDAGKGSAAAEEVCVRLIRCVADAVEQQRENRSVASDAHSDTKEPPTEVKSTGPPSSMDDQDGERRFAFGLGDAEQPPRLDPLKVDLAQLWKVKEAVAPPISPRASRTQKQSRIPAVQPRSRPSSAKAPQTQRTLPLAATARPSRPCEDTSSRRKVTLSQCRTRCTVSLEFVLD